jgi:hypothetical protein
MANAATTGAVPLKTLMQWIAAAVLDAQRVLDARAVQLAAATTRALAARNNLAELPSSGSADESCAELISNPGAFTALHRYRIAELRLEFNIADSGADILTQKRLVVVESRLNRHSENSLPASIEVNTSDPTRVSFLVAGTIQATLIAPHT